MVKKVLLICASIFTGLNMGLISCFMPIYLIINFAISGDGETLSASAFAVFALISAVISGVASYIYTYRKKREHEDVSPYTMCMAWSFCAGAVIIAIALFIYAGGEIYRI